MIEIETYPGKFEIVKKVEESSGKYNPKALIIMIDEMTEVSESDNYKLVSSIKDAISSIGRLGRAAACHLVLATQRPSSNVISNDLKNNIHQSIILGDFDTSASTLIFDEDISHKSKPEIKGRGFTKSAKNIIEFQSYWTEPEKDFRYMEEIEDKEMFKSIEKVITKKEENNDMDNIFNLTTPLDLTEDEIFGDEDENNINLLCKDIEENKITFPKKKNKFLLKINSPKNKDKKALKIKINKNNSDE